MYLLYLRFSTLKSPSASVEHECVVTIKTRPERKVLLYDSSYILFRLIERIPLCLLVNTEGVILVPRP